MRSFALVTTDVHVEFLSFFFIKKTGFLRFAPMSVILCYSFSKSHDSLVNIQWETLHYDDVIMSAMTSQITGVSIVCPTVCSGADERTHQSFASLAIVREIHRSPVDSPHKGPVARVGKSKWCTKMLSITMIYQRIYPRINTAIIDIQWITANCGYWHEKYTTNT